MSMPRPNAGSMRQARAPGAPSRVPSRTAGRLQRHAPPRGANKDILRPPHRRPVSPIGGIVNGTRPKRGRDMGETALRPEDLVTLVESAKTLTAEIDLSDLLIQI